jgi:SAM-dependent methyltransferase
MGAGVVRPDIASPGRRVWTRISGELPPLDGQAVLDLGCGAGDVAAEFVARGARVIGIDMNEDLLREARARNLPNAEFRSSDLRLAQSLDARVDGLWCSYTAAYVTDLPAALASWRRSLRPGGWAALSEIDDLFGHEPIDATTRARFDGYAREALAAGRYDFHMGRKLGRYLERSGFTVSKTVVLNDRELSFDGPAPPDVVEAWRSRLDRMTLLQAFCSPDFERIREEFLARLARDDHRSSARVYCCIATSNSVGA